MPPAIVKINDQDILKIISNDNAKYNPNQDPDAQWNSVMLNYALPWANTWMARGLTYQGPSLTVTYDNGEVHKGEFVAAARFGANFTGVNTGEDYYNRFCNPEAASSTPTSTVPNSTPTSPSTPSMPPPIIPVPRYPFPLIRDAGYNNTSGYFLNGTGYEDIAVLAISGFEVDDVDSYLYLLDMQSTVAGFLEKCRASNKTRLVIDVTGNGGGYVAGAYAVFAQVSCTKGSLGEILILITPSSFPTLT